MKGGEQDVKKKQFYNMVRNNNKLELYIFGDICSEQWHENDVTPKTIVDKLCESEADEIEVHISSYGGEVQAGLAIYNTLKNHKAKVTTYCDSFACSIASVIFMAGDERVMNEASLLMIHNAWTYANGNSAELRKIADDMDKITQASVEAYKSHSILEEKQIKKMMDAETWILPNEALSYGFATKIDKTEAKNASQNAFKQLLDIINAHQKAKAADEETEDEAENDETKVDGDTAETDDTTTEEGEEEKTEDEKEETENEDEKATQKMSCFFNAILKM